MDDRLFRHESGRLVSALTRVFGVHNLALAEDVAQDALCRALEVWKLRGVPENPHAWLLTTAKNRALDVLRRERTARTFAPELGRLVESEWTLAPAISEMLEPKAIRDDELRMMFSCCHPRLPEHVQVPLVLNILCGFGPNEIAAAFLSNEAAIEKRLARGKKTLATTKTLFDLAADGDFAVRLRSVQRALYLLFNEGYQGASEASVRTDLCDEAMRLTQLLLQHAPAATPSTLALAALMSLHAARLPARMTAGGDLIALREQDRSLWDRSLVEAGRRLLTASACGTELTEYHVEAAIAAVHADASSVAETRWGEIVTLYDHLLQIRPSPVVALNRALALAEAEGPAVGLDAIARIDWSGHANRYPFYFAALGELELRRGRASVAEGHFQAARAQARNDPERRFLEGRVEACMQSAPSGDARHPTASSSTSNTSVALGGITGGKPRAP